MPHTVDQARVAPPRSRRAPWIVALVAVLGGALGPVSGASAATAPAPACARADGTSGTCTFELEGLRQDSRSVALVIAAAGWRSDPKTKTGASIFASTRRNTRWLREAGVPTMIVETTNRTVKDRRGVERPGFGPEGVIDAAQWYDFLRAYLDSRSFAVPKRVCLYGVSSAGHVALLTAMQRPAVGCVVTEGAPTDLVALNRPVAKGRPSNAAGSARLAFADKQQPKNATLLQRNLAAFSPSRMPTSTLRMPTLMAHLPSDTVVPYSNLFTLQAGRPNVRVARMTVDRTSAKRCGFAHSCVQRPGVKGTEPGVTAASLNEWHRQAVAFIGR